MKTRFGLLAAAAVTISVPAAAQDAEGDWFGVLQVSDTVRLPLLVHLARDDAGFERFHDWRGQERLQRRAVAGGIGAHDGLIGAAGADQKA